MGPLDQVAALAEESLEDDLIEIDNTTIVKRQVIRALPLAVDTIINLAAHGTNEKMRFEASKWLIERGAPITKDASANSPIERLIADIQSAGKDS